MGVLARLLAPERAEPIEVLGKASTGVGATWLTTEPKLFSLARRVDKRAQEAQAVAIANPWIRSCERAVSQRFGRVPWHLETDDGDEVTDASPAPLRAIRDLIEKPYRPEPGEPVAGSPRTRTDLWTVVGRHMGVCGTAYVLLSRMEALGGTPLELLYLNPGRVIPKQAPNGSLLGWILDADSASPVALSPDEVVPFYLEPPDAGFVGVGLVESALTKAEMTRLADRHAVNTLASGGRIPGVFSPPVGSTIPPDKFDALVRDLRTIGEMPDAAKRMLVLEGPITFTPTGSDPEKLALIQLAEMGQDAILGLWGVPKSQLGLDAPAGLNSGGTKAYDEAVLWQGAVKPRLDAFRETMQTRILDRFREVGLGVTLVIEEPTFDDDAPKWQMAVQAVQIPLRNIERREMVGLPPFGDPMLDNEVVLPVNVAVYGAAPPVEGAKASLGRGVRSLADDLRDFLRDQGERIGRLIEGSAEHLASKPRDTSPWWDEKREGELLEKVLRPHFVEAALVGAGAARRRVGGKADVGSWRDPIIRGALGRLAHRIVQVNGTTKSIVRDLVEQAVALGMGPGTLGRVLRGVVPPLEGDTNAWLPVLNGADATFASELRAETIARTEMRTATNLGAIESYRSLGVESVRAMDGDEDEACAERDGRVFSLEDAEAEEMREHPNGTLDWIPVVARAFEGRD